MNAPARPLPTAEDSSFIFYDVESLHNIFTVVLWHNHSGHLRVFHLVDRDDALTDEAIAAATDAGTFTRAIIDANPTLEKINPDGRISIDFFDLTDADNIKRLVYSIGGIYNGRGVHNPTAGAKIIDPSMWPITDTDPSWDPTRHPFIAGYNSDAYDMTILSALFADTLRPDGKTFAPTTAERMRRHNDRMFDEYRTSMPRYLSDNDGYGSNIYWSMVNSGRHVDISKLNEKQIKVSLKRLLAQAGHQVLEADHLSGDKARVSSIDDVAELLAYNVADVLGTALIFGEQAYSSSFNLRCGLLDTYPSCLWEHTGDYATPAVGDRTKVRVDRLLPTTSSARFAAIILAPYRPLADIPGHVADNPGISYRYPADSVASERGIIPTNVLTDTRDFFLGVVDEPKAVAAFKEIYDYYRRLEGRNVNGQLPQANTVVTTFLAGLNAGLSEYGESPIPLATLFQQACGYLYRFFHGTPATIDELEAAFGDVLRASEGLYGDYVTGLRQSAQWLLRFYRTNHDCQIPFDPSDDGPITLTWPPMRGDTRYDTTAISAADVAKPRAHIAYVRPDGTPTGCFAKFSFGGIHGAEANTTLHARHLLERREQDDIFELTLIKTLADIAAAEEPGAPAADADLARAARAWATGQTDPALDEELVPTITIGTGPDTYPVVNVAAAAWWIRNRAVDVPGVGVVTHADVLASPNAKDTRDADEAGRARPHRKNTPYWRAEPKSVRRADLFVDSTPKPAAAGGMHVENELAKAYVATSVGDVIHEDFTSYYPLLLTNLAAFDNPDLAAAGATADRYRDIFDQKEALGAQLKNPELTPAERFRTKVMREGTKLILNAASGAADAGHNTNIRMNNLTVSMRIIGQLFTWRIGQAQTFAGADIVSTNTDGLYSVLDFDTNQRVLDEHSAAIGVDIEPEPLTLVSKDSNNRVEFLPHRHNQHLAQRTVASAAGGSLGAWSGPSMGQNLARPAITDRLLVDYFTVMVNANATIADDVDWGSYAPLRDRDVALSIDQPADRDVLEILLHAIIADNDPVTTLLYFQNVLASSPGSTTYLYAVDYAEGVNAAEEDTFGDATPTVLQHINRVVMVDPDLMAAKANALRAEGRHDIAEALAAPVVIAAARARKTPTATKNSRAKRGEALIRRDPTAVMLLEAAGAAADMRDKAETHDLSLGPHTALSPTQPLLVFNHSLRHHRNPEVLRAIVDCLDLDAYLDMVARNYDENWRNIR